MANRHRPSRVGSTQSHQRRPEDHARATRGACGGLLLPAIDRQPRTSVAVHALPVFHYRSVGVVVEYMYDSSFSRQTVANRRGRLATVRRWSNEHGELCLFRAMRRTKVGAEASLPRVPLHLHHVLLYTRAPNCRNDRAAPAHGRSSFLGSCSPVLSDFVMVAAPDLRDVPPLPLHIWPQVTHADAGPHARAAAVGTSVDWALFSKGR